VTKHLRKHLKGGRTYFGSQFQRFLSIIDWLYCFGPEVRQNHHGREHSCSIHGSQENRESQKGAGTRTSSQGHTPSDVFPSTKLYLLRFLPPPKIAPPAGDRAFNT
jgi:hypothetical protein